MTMRRHLCRALAARADDEKFVFLTGDLGYDALEPLREAMGPRFINAGVAEQNMVSVAAGLARNGLRPWVYSIASFIYTRPFEQIRNDVCLHDLPVRIVGNGGGYGYGVMGSTHHALEDYGTLLGLQHLTAFVPAFARDVTDIVTKLQTFEHPAYLRLGAVEESKDLAVPEYAPWRRLVTGGGEALLVIGPVAGKLIDAVSQIDESARPNLWVVTELPLRDLPGEFLADVRRRDALLVVEEHVVQGGLGQMIAHRLLSMGMAPRRFLHRAAKGYCSGLYGSQKFHRKECGLDPQSIMADLQRWGTSA
jgi:transketolase